MIARGRGPLSWRSREQKMLSILLAVAAAMGNATASVLQRKATTTQDENASALQLMLGLIRTPA